MFIHIFASELIFMELEKEIKQKKFLSEFHKASVNILFTYSWLNAKNAKFFKEYDISSHQFNILRILRGQHPNPATVNLLIERMLDKTSNASRLVDKLKEKGFVERKICKEDRRACDVWITKKGLSLLEKIDDKMEMINDLLKTISLAEAKELNRILDKLRG